MAGDDAMSEASSVEVASLFDCIKRYGVNLQEVAETDVLFQTNSKRSGGDSKADKKTEAENREVFAVEGVTRQCIKFKTTGSCSFGSKCKFLHGASKSTNPGVCYAFLENKCHRGDKCFYLLA